MATQLLALLLSASLLHGSALQTPTPAAEAPDVSTVSKEIYAFRSKALHELKDGRATTRAEADEETAVFAKNLLGSINLKSIPAKDAAEWSQLFTTAHMTTEAQTMGRRAIEFHNVQLMFTEVDLIHSLLEQGKDEEALYYVRHAPDYDPAMIGMVGESFTSACHQMKYDRTKPDFVEKGIKSLMWKVDLAMNPPGRATSMADYVYVDLNMKMLEMRYANNPSPKIISDMKVLRKRFVDSKSTNAFGQKPTFRVDEFTDKLQAMGSPAPAVTCDKSIGDFKGLQSLKGKVVVLDFMAHWCGPCKAALPGIKKLQDTYGPQGLQVVSVTSFYGYFGSQQGVSPASEFAQMHDFVKQYQMGWPVVFDTKQTTHSRYHVSAIPQLVVIDRQGMVRKVEVGYTPEGEGQIDALVKKLIDAH